ncbi:hypothetical protein FQ082_10185 [Psychrobacter sp. ANT_H56B]|uniref:hypothetical protein n=1 Tax=Psychrobacter sp. ANT_H56B TaxID=2597353 RepID=UPI0011F2ED85|nr:hypothetical protein [Psychrobacter sp. ANT_H56B]KAA0924176.1 hypothetical protein FQ082_10185 [Psychrobacter sp. ANT_H56B]
MNYKKNKFFLYVLYVLITIVGLTFSENYIIVTSAILTYLYIGYIIEGKSSIHMMFFLGYSSFIFLPALLNWYYLDTGFELYFLTSFVSTIFLKCTNKTIIKPFVDFGTQTKKIFIILSMLMIIFSLLDFGSFVEPMFAFLLFLLTLCFKQNKVKNNIAYFALFSLVFVFFSFFAWNGFGRTVVVGWFLLAALLLSYSINFRVNKYLFGLVPGFAAALLSDRSLLKLSFSGFEDALNDSAYQPYRLASSFIDNFNNNGFDISGFFDQILFTFFIFIPRDIWVSKPNGFGFEYTVRNFDQSLIDAGHSIASTLIGDHIYFLGYLGVFTSIIVLLLIAYIIRIFYRIKSLNGNGVVIFSASMMVLVWGGMTSFSARVALPSIIFIFLIVLFRRVFTGELKLNFKVK